MIKNIFFDFDGVVAESVSAKTEAFREMYLSYGENIANEVVEYHVKSGGVSRFDKFKYWQKKYFDEDLTEEKMNLLTSKFSNMVLNKVINSDEVLGCHSFLMKHSSNFKMWIITGTPTDEIEIILDKRKLSKYFIGYHGSPESKQYWTEHLIGKHGLNREETLFLGDATTDFEAAKFSKLHFALRDNIENKKLFKNYNGLRFSDFYELEALLSEKGLLRL